MNQYSITLKNLYRILTVNDYPIFSNGVFPASRRKGLTLVAFWRNLLVPEWQYGPSGRKLWRKNSRYLSEFCNRKDVIPFYADYQKEIFHELTPDLFLNQIESIMQVFRAYQYDQTIFRDKIEFMINAGQNDDHIKQEDSLYLSEQISTGSKDKLPEEFLNAWIFSILTVCAMCRNAAGVDHFMHLVRNGELEITQLFSIWKQR